MTAFVYDDGGRADAGYRGDTRDCVTRAIAIATGRPYRDGRIIVRLSRHISAVIDGVIHDTYDPSRDGTRCVYGYWKPSDQPCSVYGADRDGKGTMPR